MKLSGVRFHENENGAISDQTGDSAFTFSGLIEEALFILLQLLLSGSFLNILNEQLGKLWIEL